MQVFLGFVGTFLSFLFVPVTAGMEVKMKKVLVTFWIPKEVEKEYNGKIELIYPHEELTGQYSMEEIKSLLPM